MSEALERVIAEQQAEIDRLKAINANCMKAGADRFHREESLCEAAANLIDWYRLRGCWKDDKKSEWDEYHKLAQKVRLQLMDHGWCFNCGTLTCHGDCYDE